MSMNWNAVVNSLIKQGKEQINWAMKLPEKQSFAPAITGGVLICLASALKDGISSSIEPEMNADDDLKRILENVKIGGKPQ